MVLIGDLGERQLIKDFMSFIPKEGKIGPGDDAALVNDAVVSTDSFTFSRHFPAGMTYEQFGWYTAAASFSDLAAMGARPSALFCNLILPEDLDSQCAYDIMSGIGQCAEYCGTGIAGGDTKFGPGVITTTALGSMDGYSPMLRSGARYGDVIAVTGPLGGPAAGFLSLDLGMDVEDARQSLYVPIPRVPEGRALVESGAVSSCMDLSDGLGTAINTICKESKVGADIETSFIPRHPDLDKVAEASGADADDLLFGWGGEYELLFTANPDRLESIYDRGVEFSIIGMINDSGEPCKVDGGKREAIPFGKY